MELKSDVWERVIELANLLVNEDQTDKFWANYNLLKDYAEAQSQGGYNHPILWETLADFTPDDAASIPLYLKALDAASPADAGEYRATIQFALAERYKLTGQAELARDCAIAADDEARALKDHELRRRINAFLREE